MSVEEKIVAYDEIYPISLEFMSVRIVCENNFRRQMTAMMNNLSTINLEK